MGIRLDETGFGSIKIYQNPDDFCYGVDAVLLADFASDGINRKNRKARVMDLGTGTGIIPLILSHKTDAEYIGGIEVQRESWELAQRNIAENGLEGRLEFFCSNVKNFNVNKTVKPFDVVTANPPYTAGTCGIESSHRAKAVARHEIEGSLDDFVKTAAALLIERGDFYMVHRPSRIVDICCICRKYRLEPKELRFISGRPMEKPNILLIHCVKNGRSEMRILKPLAVHYENGKYTDEILGIYERI